MSALALPAAPRRWPAALALDPGRTDWPRCWPCRSNRAGARRARRLRLPVPGLGLSHLGKPARRAARGSLTGCRWRPAWSTRDGGAGRPAPPRCWAWRWPGAPVARSGGVAAGGRHHRAAAQHPGAVATLCLVRPVLRLPDARQAWGAAAGCCCPIADWRWLQGWLPQAASLIVAMLIAGWAIRRRRLATDGPAHRGHVSAHPRRAPGWRWPACCSPGPSCPRPSPNCQSGGLACKAAGNPASNSPRWSSACRCSMPPIADIVRASVRAVPAGWSRPEALALSRLDILRLVVAPNAARVALPPYANQCLALIKNSTLAIAIGYQDRWPSSTPPSRRPAWRWKASLALAAYLAWPWRWAARCPRGTRAAPGMARAICMARAWANGRHCLPLAGKAADAGAATGQDGCCWRRCSPPVRSSTGPLLNAVWRRRGGCAQAAGACWAAGREPAPVAVGAMPAHRGCPGRLRRCCAGGRRRGWARAGCPDGYAPASPSPRWRLPPARCPAGPGRRGHRPALGRPAGHADPGDRGAAGPCRWRSVWRRCARPVPPARPPPPR